MTQYRPVYAVLVGNVMAHIYILVTMVSDKKEELRKAANAKKRQELQFLKSQMEKDLKVN